MNPYTHYNEHYTSICKIRKREEYLMEKEEESKSLETRLAIITEY